MSNLSDKLRGIERRTCVNGHDEVIRVDNGNGTLQRICLHPDCDYSVADEWQPKEPVEEVTTIDVQKQYSKYLGGRFAKHGKGSAEELRLRHLLPALVKPGKVRINFGTALACASFTEEAFGGLVRAGFSANELRERLEIVSQRDERLAPEAWNYIERADAHRQEDIQKRRAAEMDSK